jgi:hypothetical protein
MPHRLDPSKIKKEKENVKKGKGKAKKHRRHIREELHATGHEPEYVQQVEDMMQEMKKHHKVTHINEHDVFRTAKKTGIAYVKILVDSKNITARNLGPSLRAMDRETRSRSEWFKKEAGIKSLRDQRRMMRRENIKHMIRIAEGPNVTIDGYNKAVKAMRYAPLVEISRLARDKKVGEEGFMAMMDEFVRDGKEGSEIHYHRVNQSEKPKNG